MREGAAPRNPWAGRAAPPGGVAVGPWWILALLPLLPSLGVGFLLDDWIGLARLLDGGWGEVAAQLRPAGGPFVRPLGWLLFQVELTLFGVRGAAFHAVHLGLFALAAWLTGRLAGHLAGGAPGVGRAGGWAAALALLYPGRIEAYAWLAAAFDLLALVLGLGLLLLHLRCRRRVSPAAAAGLAALAFTSTLAKESAYAVAVVILVWELVPGLLEAAPRRGRLLAGGAAAAGFALGGLHRLAVVGGIGGYPGTGPEDVTERLPLLPEVLLRAAFAPVHPGYGTRSAVLAVLSAAAFAAVLAAGLLRARRRPEVRRLLLAGATLALVGLLPVLPYLRPTAHWTAGRFLTLFGAGLALAAAAPAAGPGEGRLRRLATGALAALTLAWAAATVLGLVPWREAARSRDAVLQAVGEDTAGPGLHRVWVAGPINRWQGVHVLGGALDAALGVTYPDRRIEADSAFLQRLEGRPVRPPRPEPGVERHLYRCRPRKGGLECGPPPG